MSHKICTSNEFYSKLESCREANKTIVFTNGCFDILHPGHIQYLEEAKSMGDLLIVGLNDDDSVRRLKGHGRPLNNYNDRAIMLAGLSSVDLVTAFSEDTPIKLIELVCPDILVKGGDYKLDEIAGRDFVEKHGGRVLTIPFKKGYSTSSIIEKMKNLRI